MRVCDIVREFVLGVGVRVDLSWGVVGRGGIHWGVISRSGRGVIVLSLDSQSYGS